MFFPLRVDRPTQHRDTVGMVGSVGSRLLVGVKRARKQHKRNQRTYFATRFVLTQYFDGPSYNPGLQTYAASERSCPLACAKSLKGRTSGLVNNAEKIRGGAGFVSVFVALAPTRMVA